MNKEEYNKEWIKLSQELQKLERKRVELYKAYQEEHGTLDFKIERSPSKYYDLNGVNIDIFERN